MSIPTFRQDNQGEIVLFPSRLDEKISPTHIVRLINRMVNGMDLQDLLSDYKGGGASAYHPRMLLKVLLYAYCMKIYTGRKIANALETDITFMWLSGNQTPNFRTINSFRSGRLKESIEQVFKSLLSFMFEEKYILLEEYYCDGTTLLADANKHKVVWKKNQQRLRQLVDARIDQTIKEIDDLNEEEANCYGANDLALKGKADPSREERLQHAVSKLNHILSREDKTSTGKAKKLHTKLVTDVVRSEIYKEREEKCGSRSGYSKTDPDATPMHTKECFNDLRPGYNGMIGTEGQYIVGASIHQNPNDAACFKEHIEQALNLMPKKMETIIADAGFGTEENYEHIEEELKMEGLLKFPSYDKEQQKSFKENPFHRDNMIYSVESDAYQCPNGKWLYYSGDTEEKSKSGFVSTSRNYTCEDCSGCAHFDQCGYKRKEASSRTIKVNLNLERHKQQVREMLKTEQGQRRIKQRPPDVEGSFGDIKGNQLFRRVHLRGLQKVKTEFTIIAMAHNLRKMHIAVLKKAN